MHDSGKVRSIKELDTESGYRLLIGGLRIKIQDGTKKNLKFCRVSGD